MGWLRKKKPKSDIASERGAMLLEDLIECCDGKSNPIKFFSADQIRKATHNFSETNLVSELSDLKYKWYLGKNENHLKVLIKKGHYNRAEEFCRDVTVSSMVSGHKYFLKLVGCCLEFEDPVTFYHGGKKHYKLDDISEQPWKRRMKIAEDIANALAYLHTAFPRPFVYRTLSLGKILLDEDGVAKLTDFSYCVSIPKGQTFVKVDSLVGLYGHLEYSYLRTGVVSEKTDVFAFGIIMQTLLIGEERFRMNYPGRQFANRLSKFNEGPRMVEIADPKMLEKMGEISKQELCQMNAFLILSLHSNLQFGLLFIPRLNNSGADLLAKSVLVSFRLIK